MQILEGKGLIEYSATRRPRVANPSMEVIATNLDIIGSLEALAGELPCERATAAVIEPIRGLRRNMEVGSITVPLLKFFRWYMELHALVVAASQDSPLIGNASPAQCRPLARAILFLADAAETGKHATAACGDPFGPCRP